MKKQTPHLVEIVGVQRWLTFKISPLLNMFYTYTKDYVVDRKPVKVIQATKFDKFTSRGLMNMRDYLGCFSI